MRRKVGPARWSANVKHDAEPAATVLDPFGGTGTVGLVAQRLSGNRQVPLGLVG